MFLLWHNFLLILWKFVASLTFRFAIIKSNKNLLYKSIKTISYLEDTQRALTIRSQSVQFKIDSLLIHTSFDIWEKKFFLVAKIFQNLTFFLVTLSRYLFSRSTLKHKLKMQHCPQISKICLVGFCKSA